jgi:hypothetical protein
MTELIAAGADQTAWADVTVAAGASKALFIKSGTANQTAPANAVYEIAYKVGSSDYEVFDRITPSNIACKGVITAPGTFGLRRIATGATSGMNTEG